MTNLEQIKARIKAEMGQQEQPQQQPPAAAAGAEADQSQAL